MHLIEYPKISSRQSWSLGSYTWNVGRARRMPPEGWKDECAWHLDVTMGIAIVTILLALHLLSYFVVEPKGKPNIQRNNAFKEIFAVPAAQAKCFNERKGQHWQII